MSRLLFQRTILAVAVITSWFPLMMAALSVYLVLPDWTDGIALSSFVLTPFFASLYCLSLVYLQTGNCPPTGRSDARKYDRYGWNMSKKDWEHLYQL